MTLRLRMEDVKNFKLIVKNYGQKEVLANQFRYGGVDLVVLIQRVQYPTLSFH